MDFLLKGEGSVQRAVYCECTKTVNDRQSQSSECSWLRSHRQEFQDIFTLSKSESESEFDVTLR